MRNGVQAKTVRWLFTRSLPTPLMCFVNAAKVSVLVVSNKLTNRLTVKHLQLGRTEWVVTMRAIRCFGSRYIQNPVRNASLVSRRTKDACTWLAEAASTNFVGYVWVITEITQQKQARDYATLGKMWWMLAEESRLMMSTCWSVKWRKLNIFQTDTLLTRRPLSLHNRDLRKSNMKSATFTKCVLSMKSMTSNSWLK